MQMTKSYTEHNISCLQDHKSQVFWGKKCQYNLTTIMMGKSCCVDNHNKHMIRNRKQALRCILSCYENSNNGYGLF